MIARILRTACVVLSFGLPAWPGPGDASLRILEPVEGAEFTLGDRNDARSLAATGSTALPWPERIALEQALAGSDPRYLPRMDEGGPVLDGSGSAVASFSREGAHIALDGSGSPAHEVTLRAVAMGRTGDAELSALGSSARPAIAGTEVRTDRGDGIVEWWRSLPSGLEHGVTVGRRPTGDGELVVVVAIEVGALAARALSGDAVELVDASGARVATYAHLVVLDAVGVRVPAHMAVAGGRIRIEVDDAGATYPLRIDPLLFAAEEATLLASGGAARDHFGYSVSLSADGSRALVGAPLADTAGGTNAGSARVFLRSGSSWAEEATLLASGGAADD
jgi:hypothetical protein